METVWIVAIVYIAVDIIGACFMARAAADKGYEDTGAGLLCFFLGVFGYLYVIALPDKKAQRTQELILAALTGGQVGVSSDVVDVDELPDL
jgi:hypothetical protein